MNYGNEKVHTPSRSSVAQAKAALKKSCSREMKEALSKNEKRTKTIHPNYKGSYNDGKTGSY